MPIVKPSKPYTFIDGPGNTAVGAEVNVNFDTIYSKIGEVIDAVNNAAGTKATLDARLDVALNEDGTPRSTVTSGGEWINPGFTATYISTTQFSVPGDQRDIYQVGRRVKVGLSASTVYSAVSASTHGAGITTVTVGSVLTNPISRVEHGIVTPDNGRSSLPTDFMTTAATPNKGVLRDTDGKIFANQTYTARTGQTSWDRAALVSVGIDSNGSAVGFANGVSGVMLVHPPGGGIEARNGDRSALIKIKAAPGVAADDAVVMSQLATTATPNTGVLRDANGGIDATAATFQKAQTTWDTAAVRSVNASNPSGKAIVALQNYAAAGQLVLPAAGGRLEARNAADALIPVSGGNAANPEDFVTKAQADATFVTKAQADATRPTSYMTTVDTNNVSTARIVASQTIDVAAGDVVLIQINASLIKWATEGDTRVYVVKSGGTANIHSHFNGRGIVDWNSMVRASEQSAVAMSGSVKAETSGTLGLAMYAQSSGSPSTNNGCFMSVHVLR